MLLLEWAGIGATASIATDIYNGNKNPEEIIVNAATEAGKGAVVGAVSSAITTVAGVVPATIVMTGGDILIHDVIACVNGKISGEELMKNMAIKSNCWNPIESCWHNDWIVDRWDDFIVGRIKRCGCYQ